MDERPDGRVGDTARLEHDYNAENFRRSVRDAVWYAGQVIVMSLSYKQHHLGVYAVIAVIALIICAVTVIASVKWRRELRRDKASGRTAAAKEAATAAA